MNVLDRITELRLSKGWSEYQLSEQSGLTQSTISSWYRKNLSPSIPSLEKICKAFGITLSQFFIQDESETIQLTSVQKDLLIATSKLNEQQICFLIEFIKSL